MKNIHRRLEKLEAASAHRSDAVDAEAQALAHAQLSEFFDALAGEKAGGDVHGIAARNIAEVLAALERQA